MSIVHEDEKAEMSIERQKAYCKWCFYHDFGYCDNCALRNIYKEAAAGTMETANTSANAAKPPSAN